MDWLQYNRFIPHLLRMNPMNNIFGLALILIPTILIIFLITRLNRNQLRRVMEMQENNHGFERGLRNAIQASATVISKNETIVPNAGGLAKVNLQMEVILPGKAPYQVSTSWLVEIDSLDKVLPGQIVPVKVDPKKPIRIFPNVPWATAWIFGK
jgi:hypothetical protein